MLLDRLLGKPKQEITQEVNVNMTLQSAVQEVRQLDAASLKQISALLEQNVVEGVYTEIEPSE